MEGGDYLVLELVGEVGGVEKCQRLLPERQFVLCLENPSSDQLGALETGSEHRVAVRFELRRDEVDLSAPARTVRTFDDNQAALGLDLLEVGNPLAIELDRTSRNLLEAQAIFPRVPWQRLPFPAG